MRPERSTGFPVVEQTTVHGHLADMPLSSSVPLAGAPEAAVSDAETAFYEALGVIRRPVVARVKRPELDVADSANSLDLVAIEANLG
jgi:hypothetical protein